MTLLVQNGIVQMQEQRHLPAQRADVEGQEIGDREAQGQRDHPDDQAELERAEIGVPGDLLGEHVDIVLEAEGRDQHVVGFVVEEAHDHDQDHRHDEEQQEYQRQRRHQEIGREARAAAGAPGAQPPAADARRRAGRRRGPRASVSSGRDELVPLADHVLVLVHDRVPAPRPRPCARRTSRRRGSRRPWRSPRRWARLMSFSAGLPSIQ